MSDQFMRIVEILLNSFWPLCKAALKYTIPLTIVSFGCGTVLAFITAIFRLSGVRILQGIAKFYIWIIRGTPLLVQLFVIFYGLPSLGIVLSPFVSGVLGLSLCQGAYNSEIVRAAILSVPSGQWEAAKALGMTRAQTYIVADSRMISGRVPMIVISFSFPIATPPQSRYLDGWGQTARWPT